MNRSRALVSSLGDSVGVDWVAQLRERGITVELDSEVYPNGRFARLSDPEGNPSQLWQPGGKDPG